MGVFICCPTPSLPAVQARLSKILTDIVAGQEFKGHQPHQHLALLHYCHTKKKYGVSLIPLHAMHMCRSGLAIIILSYRKWILNVGGS